MNNSSEIDIKGFLPSLVKEPKTPNSSNHKGKYKLKKHHKSHCARIVAKKSNKA
ncbi:unnamed protein product [Moneuplotes crassus]|uniref:Uncharacterized protein n=1 Tax=Euplotes crassus TaxID=5936 RepID=A0AAD2D3N9_EUPCR|nr:unnamed protein product [Moneuplotes crassus]